MKGSILKSAAALLFVLAIVGCKNLFLNVDGNEKTAGNTASISVQVGNAARQMDPAGYKGSISSIELTGKLNGGETKTLKTWQSAATGGSAFDALSQDPTINDLDIGRWEFTLTCSSSDGVVCTGTATKTLVAGNNGAIHFELENVSGEGAIKITLDYSGAAEKDAVTKIVVEVKTLDGNTPQMTTYEKDSPVPDYSLPRDGVLQYRLDEVENGSYIVTFTIYRNDTDDTTTAAELVNVAGGCTTTGTLTLTDLNKTYSIAYKYNQVPQGTTPTWDDIPAAWLASGTLPLTFTKHDTITLPTASDIVRPYEEPQDPTTGQGTGYIFVGWYTSSDFSTEPVTTINGASLQSDQTLYAKFQELQLESGSNAPTFGVQTPAAMNLEFRTNATVPQYWYENTEWTSDSNSLYIDHYEANTSTYRQVTVYARADGIESGKLIATLNGKKIGEVPYTISDSFNYNTFKAIESDKNNISVDDFSTIESAVTSVSIPNGYKTIENNAFEDNSFITSLEIPESVETIGGSAFAGCTSLASVTILAENPPDLGSVALHTGSNTPPIIYVPSSAVQTYIDACTGSGAWANSGVQSGQIYAIGDIPVTGISLKADTVRIGVNTAFDIRDVVTIEPSNGTITVSLNPPPTGGSLTGITYADGKITTGQTEQQKDISVSISAGLINTTLNLVVYANDVFDNVALAWLNSDTSITSYEIPYGFTSITGVNSKSSFDGYGSITQVTIPASVTKIEGYAFQECDKLTSVSFAPNASLTTIERNAFTSCSKLGSITIPESVTSIGESTFAYCSKLETVVMEPTNPPELGDDVFPDTLVGIYLSENSLQDYVGDSSWAAYKGKFKVEGKNVYLFNLDGGTYDNKTGWYATIADPGSAPTITPQRNDKRFIGWTDTENRDLLVSDISGQTFVYYANWQDLPGYQ